MKITARYEFEAAHSLRDHSLSEADSGALYGPCARVHGHTYRLEVTIAGDRLRHGMLVNFNDVDALIREHVTSVLDHGSIDEIEYFQSVPSTAENISAWIWRQLEPLFAADSAALDAVTVYEGDRFSATVTREDA